MQRKIVHIDEEKCTGCGLCAKACHEGAIEVINGKAHLIRDDYCDGFGDCLPECPAGAITIEEREAEAYDRAAVEARMHAAQTNLQQNQESGHVEAQPFSGCPGSRIRMMHRNRNGEVSAADGTFHQEQMRHSGMQASGTGNGEGMREERPTATTPAYGEAAAQSELQTWPVQLKLVPVIAPFFDNAKLLIAADCTAYAYARFHEDFIRNHVVLIGCPKLDRVDYMDKIQAILERNNIKSLEIVRMEVPCCGGLEDSAKRALQNSGKFTPWRVVTIGIDGRILEDA